MLSDPYTLRVLYSSSLKTTPLPQHRMHCITSTWKGLVDMGNILRVYFLWSAVKFCHSLKCYPAMPANVARSLFIHSRDTKTVWHFHQTLLRAGDAIHPVLWKRCGFQTNTALLYTVILVIIK